MIFFTLRLEYHTLVKFKNLYLLINLVLFYQAWLELVLIWENKNISEYTT